jgi:hypothetical protein
MRKAMTVVACFLWLALTVAPALAATAQQEPTRSGDKVQAATGASDRAVPGVEVATTTAAGAKQEQKKDANELSKETYNGGFRLATEDGRFSLRIAAGLQLRYTFMWLDHDVSGNQANYSNFYLRRARVWLDGNAYNQKFTYYFHVQLEPSSAVNLHDAWINYAFSRMFQLGVGRNKIAYGLEFLNSAFSLDFIERSVMSGETDVNNGGGLSKYPGGGTENFANSGQDANTGFPVGGLNLFRSQGVQVQGRSGGDGPVFEYQAGVWDGRNTKGASNPDASMLYAARAGFYPNGWINWTQQGDMEFTGNFRAGFLFSAYANGNTQDRNAAGSTVPLYEARDHGVDFAIETRYRGFSSDFEFAREHYSLQDATLVGPHEFDRQGWRVQAGYFLVPKFVQVVGRYAENDRLLNPTVASVRNSGLGFARVRNAAGEFQEAAEKKIDEVTGGLNFYLSRNHQHKLFFDYSRLTRQFAGYVTQGELNGSVPDQKDSRFRAMIQMKF